MFPTSVGVGLRQLNPPRVYHLFVNRESRFLWPSAARQDRVPGPSRFGYVKSGVRHLARLIEEALEISSSAFFKPVFRSRRFPIPSSSTYETSRETATFALFSL